MYDDIIGVIGMFTSSELVTEVKGLCTEYLSGSNESKLANLRK